MYNFLIENVMNGTYVQGETQVHVYQLKPAFWKPKLASEKPEPALPKPFADKPVLSSAGSKPAFQRVHVSIWTGPEPAYKG